MDKQKIISLILALIPVSLIFSSQLNSVSIIIGTLAIIGYSVRFGFDYKRIIWSDYIYFLLVLYAFFIDKWAGNELDTPKVIMVLSFVIFPSLQGGTLPKISRGIVERVFAYAVPIVNGLIFVYLITNAYYGNSTFGSGEFREEVLRPLDIHPTYYSMFCIVSIIFMIDFLRKGGEWYNWVGIAANILIVLFVTSKGAILSLIVILFIVIGVLIRDKVLPKYSILLLVALIIGFYFIPMVQVRLDNFLNTIFQAGAEAEYSTDRRMRLYKAMIANSIESPLFMGLGLTGGVDLIKEISGLNFNAHNQFFQVYYNSGILGLLFFVFYLVRIFWRSITNRDLTFMLFCVTTYVNLIFENLFDRQWGIVFFSFFVFLFSIMRPEKEVEQQKIE